MSVPIPLGTSDYNRSVGHFPPVTLENRYFETNPTNQENQVSLLTRPGFKKWLFTGTARIQNIFYEAGCFNDDLFVVEGANLHRISKFETVSNYNGIFNTAFGQNGKVTVKMASTASIGTTPAYLWFADGVNLWVYAESGPATGQIALLSGNAVEGASIRVGNYYYYFTSIGDFNNTGNNGASGTPFYVRIGTNTAESILNLRNALNGSGVAGVTYSVGLVANPSVVGFVKTDNSAFIQVYSRDFSTGGNSVVLSIVNSAGTLNASGDGMTGGGTANVSQVVMPDDVGALDVTFIAGYIIIVCTEGYGVNGRFYWAGPGELVIDPLNFATAEREPDTVYACRTIEDQFWLFGNTTTEVWYPTGNFDSPFQRMEGKLFNRGVHPGTDVKIQDAVILVGNDGVVYSVQDSPQRVSESSIEEKIRFAIAAQPSVGEPLRSWTYSADGHDFYVLYLPSIGSYVLDTTTGQWSHWHSAGTDTLYQHVGLNWVPMGSATYGRGQKTNVVSGDLRGGQLWLIDITRGYDESYITGEIEAFPCSVSGGVTMRARQTVSCGTATLAAYPGTPSVSGATITLSTSDDEGRSWQDHDTLTIASGTYTGFQWKSLGTIKAPGRIFKVTDLGGTLRIDGLDMN